MLEGGGAGLGTATSPPRVLTERLSDKKVRAACPESPGELRAWRSKPGPSDARDERGHTPDFQCWGGKRPRPAVTAPQKDRLRPGGPGLPPGGWPASPASAGDAAAESEFQAFSADFLIRGLAEVTLISSSVPGGKV